MAPWRGHALSASRDSIAAKPSTSPASARIGRATDNDLPLSDSGATRYHTLIQWVGRGFIAHDLGSSNGTFVNGQHIVDDHELKDGDVLQVGNSRLRFERLDKKDP